jgi:integrase
VPGLPDRFCFHDLRHYLASLLIASGADIKTVQARMRHATAATTLDVYGHLWPDADESTRAAVGAAIAARETPADALRTIRPEALQNRRSGG